MYVPLGNKCERTGPFFYKNMTVPITTKRRRQHLTMHVTLRANEMHHHDHHRHYYESKANKATSVFKDLCCDCLLDFNGSVAD